MRLIDQLGKQKTLLEGGVRLENVKAIRQIANDSSLAKMSLEKIIQLWGCEETVAPGGKCNTLEPAPGTN